MVRVFISHAQEDATCVKHIHHGLESKGYSVWQNPQKIEPGSILYSGTVENAILGSAAVILVWSSSATRSEWVERHVHFAQRLKKPIFPVTLDRTDVPNTLVSVTPVVGQPLCIDVVTLLMQQAQFPAPSSSDPLIKLYEQMTKDKIGERKDAIEHAIAMFNQGEHREELLALLDYVSHNDVITTVRERARGVLDAQLKKNVSLPSHSTESRHKFAVRCKNGHVTEFDKRLVCNAHSDITRTSKQSAGVELDELHLKCEQCGIEVVARVDCRDYK